MDELRYQSEERFRLLVESVKEYAIFMLDCDGYVASWNAGAERITGYAASEAIGAHFSRFYADEARETRWPEHHVDGGGLAGAVGSEQTHDLRPAHTEGDVLDGADVPIALAQALHSQHIGGRARAGGLSHSHAPSGRPG